MPSYRLFRLDVRGHVTSSVELADIASDAEAIDVALQCNHEHGMELWDAARRVMVFPAPRPPGTGEGDA